MTYNWDDVPMEEEMGPKGSRVTFKNKQGLDITGYLFPADNAKAVVYLLHGHGCHLPFEFLASQGVGKHHVYSGSWVEHLNSCGFSVCGIDIQSHGRSEGLHGLRFYFNSFDDLVDDVIQFQREHVKTLDSFKELPTFLCGISMGGCLATCVLNRVWDEGIYKGGVLLAPMLSLERVSRQLMNRILRPISSLMNLIAPTLAIVKVAENTMFPKIQEEFNVDPYTSGGTDTRVRVAVEYLNVTANVMSSIQQSKFDFIAFHSEKDMFTDPEGSKALYAKSCAKSKTLTLLDSMWHYLTHEDGNMNVLQGAISWMNERGVAESNQA